MSLLIAIEDVYARAGRPMRSHSRVGEGVVVGWQEFAARLEEDGWLHECELLEDDLDLYRALPSRTRATVRRVVNEVLGALEPYVGSFAPAKVARVRGFWFRTLSADRWHELFHKLVLAEEAHLNQRFVNGGLPSTEARFRVRLMEVRDLWERALSTPQVSVHELHAVLTVASLVLLHEVERAVHVPHSARHDAVLE